MRWRAFIRLRYGYYPKDERGRGGKGSLCLGTLIGSRIRCYSQEAAAWKGGYACAVGSADEV